MHAAEASHGDIGMITRDDVLLAHLQFRRNRRGAAADPACLAPRACRSSRSPATRNRRWRARPACISTSASPKRPARSISRPRPAPRPRSRSAMRWRWPCSRRAASRRRISRARIPAARSAASCCCTSPTSCAPATTCRSVGPEALLADGLVVMSKKGLGMCVVVEDGRMLGVFTDGDLRRVLDRESNVHTTPMREVMTSPGKSVQRHGTRRRSRASHGETPHHRAARHRRPRARSSARSTCTTCCAPGCCERPQRFQAGVAPRAAAGAGRRRRAHRRAAVLRRAEANR